MAHRQATLGTGTRTPVHCGTRTDWLQTRWVLSSWRKHLNIELGALVAFMTGGMRWCRPCWYQGYGVHYSPCRRSAARSVCTRVVGTRYLASGEVAQRRVRPEEMLAPSDRLGIAGEFYVILNCVGICGPMVGQIGGGPSFCPEGHRGGV